MATSDRLTPQERRLRASLAAHASWASTADRTRRTQAARDAFLARFEDQVDPERKLPEAQRRQMAESARKAHFQRLALRSSQARRRKSEGDAA